MIHSDWHIHSEFSYDAKNPLADIIKGARERGYRLFGITDHLNYNDQKFMGDLLASAENVKKLQVECPEMILGVELTPVEKPLYDYVAETGTRDGYQPPIQDTPYEIELAATKEELKALGVRYAIGASHWRVDVDRFSVESTKEELIREWYRQQLWLAADERVTILGHPWYNGKAMWYDDFSAIPRSMNEELAAALKENGKYAEFNPCMLCDSRQTKKFRHAYAEFLRELFEKGIRITYGSDSHDRYSADDRRAQCYPYLEAAGFKEGDFSELSERDLW